MLHMRQKLAKTKTIDTVNLVAIVDNDAFAPWATNKYFSCQKVLVV